MKKALAAVISVILTLTWTIVAHAQGNNPCIASSETNCSVATGAGLVMTQYPDTWPYVGLGVPVTIVAAPTTNLPGLLDIATTGEDCSYTDEVYLPGTGPGTGSVISSGWTANGSPGSGSGLTATFTPTNLGPGTNVFFLNYSNAPLCGGTNGVFLTNTFIVVSNANLGLAENLMDISFGGNPPTKTGFAAVGLTTSDYWNPYGTSYGGLTYGVITNLAWVDGASSGASLLVSNAPYSFAWIVHPPDPMYDRGSYVNTGRITLTLTNMSAGTYDFYVYAHGNASNLNQTVDLVSAGQDYGSQTTASAGTNWTSTRWQEGQQYVLFWAIPVTQNSNVVITVTNGGGGTSSMVNGIQIVQQYGFTVASLTPTNNTNCVLYNSNATLQTWYVPVSSNPAVSNLEVIGTPNPNVAPANLPEDWSINGVRTNIIFLSITNIATYTVVCSVGTSAITNIIEVGGAVYNFSNGYPGILINCFTNSGQLQMNSVANTTPLPFVTIPNSYKPDPGNIRVGTVARIQVGTNPAANPSVVVGEFFSVPADQGGDPSRTTVDRYGNVWTGNRAADGLDVDGDINGMNMGSITEFGVVIGGIRGNKVPYDTNLGPNYLGLTNWSFVVTNTGEYLEPPFIYNTCIDRDGDGLIHTSSGLGDVLSWGPNDSLVDGITNAADEMVLRYIHVMPTGVRSIPIDGSNNFWAGSCTGDHIGDGYQEFIDTGTGMPVTGYRFYFGPGGYGGVISGDGSVWSQGRNTDDSFKYTSGMLRFFPQAGIPPVLIGGVINQQTASENTPNSYYGIGIDPLTDQPWTAGNGSPGTSCYSTNGSWEQFVPPGVNSSGRGILVDAKSNVWMAGDSANGVFHLSTTGDFIGFIPFNGLHIGTNAVNASTPLGVSMDSQGMVWAVCENSSSAVRIDPTQGPTTNLNGTNYTVGEVVESVNLAPGGSPYTYSDMTGYVSLSTTQPAGVWDFVQDSGETNMLWSSITESTNVPAQGASIVTEVRAADRVTDLPTWPFRTVTGTNIPPGIKGRYMEVRVNLLRTFGFATGPTLNSLTLGWGTTLGTALQITNQPHNAEVPPGSNVTFTVGASIPAGDSVSYQWRTNDSAVNNGGFISGATSSVLVISNAQYNNAGRYSVIVTDNSNTNTVLYSAEARLHIMGNSPTNVSEDPSVVISGPQTLGQSATFTAYASAASNAVPGGQDMGVVPIYYQWRFGQTPLTNAGSSGICVLTNLSGASNTYYTQFTLNNLQCTNQGFYSVVFWNQYGELLSPNAQLSPGGSPTVSITPAFTEVSSPSQAVTLTADVSCQSWVAAQWYVTGPENIKRPILGATNLTYTLPNPISCGNIGTYAFDVFDSSRFPVEATAVVTSVSHGAAFTTTSNIAMVLYPTPDGNSVWTYTNQYSVNGGATWLPYPPNGATLTIAMNGSQDGNFYRITATQSNGSIITNTASMMGALNSSSQYGPNLVVFNIANAIGNVVITAEPPAEYGPWVSWNWSFLNQSGAVQPMLPANVFITNAQGVNTNVCTITNVACGDLGSFVAQVGDACGNGTEPVANVLTETPPALSSPATTVTNLIVQLIPTNVTDPWSYSNQVSTNGGINWQPYPPNGPALAMTMNGNQNGYFFRVIGTDPAGPNARVNQTANLLPGGQVLVAAGQGNDGTLASCQLYNFSPWGAWLNTGAMNVARYSQGAASLLNGEVLVAGGSGTNATSDLVYLNSAELYNPVTGIWTPTGPLNTARVSPTANLLLNGEVLIAGGITSGEIVLSGTELYNPDSGTWAAGGSMQAPRDYHTATLLTNGQVLVTGGSNNITILNSAEVYTPSTGLWTNAASMHAPREWHAAALLTNGQVLVTGGWDGAGGILNSGEAYTPSTGAWTTNAMVTARYMHTETVLTNGQVLAVGGWGTTGALTNAELYNPSTGAWNATGSMNFPRASHTATLLPNGQVLVAGGYVFAGGGYSGDQIAVTTAELYNPNTGQWTPTESLDTAGVTVSLSSSSSNGPDLDVLAIQNATANLTIMAQQPSTLGPWSWDWTFASSATDMGTNNGTCTISNIVCGDFGSYSAQVSDPCGNAAQPVATVLDEALPGQSSPITTMQSVALTLHPIGNGTWNCAAYGNSTFVAIQSGNNGAAYSKDGIGWFPTTMPTSNNWESVAFGLETNTSVTNNIFVAVAQGTNAAYSYDGIFWWHSVLPSPGNWSSVAFGTNNVGSNIYVAIGQGTNAAYSYTGTNWIGGSGMPVSANWSSVAYGINNNGNNIFVAVASGNNNAAYSYDGINWTSSPTGTTMPGGEGATSIAFGNPNGNVFVAISGSGFSDTASSVDGVNWATSGNLPVGDNWVSAVFGNNQFVAITSNDNQVATCSDGANWNSANPLPSNLFDALAANTSSSGASFIAVGGANSAAFINSSGNWSPTTMASSDNWNYSNQVSTNGGSTWQPYPLNGSVLSIYMDGGIQAGDYFRIVAADINSPARTASVTTSLNYSSTNGPALGVLSITNATADVTLTAQQPNGLGPWTSWGWQFETESQELQGGNRSTLPSTDDAFTITNISCGTLGYYTATVSDSCGKASEGVTAIVDETVPNLEGPETTMQGFVLQFTPTNQFSGWVFTNQLSTNGGTTWQYYPPNGSSLTNLFAGNQDGYYFRITATSGTHTASVTLLLSEPDFSPLDPELDITEITNGAANLILTAQSPAGLGPWTTPTWSFFDESGAPQSMPGNATVNAAGQLSITIVGCGDLGYFEPQQNDECGNPALPFGCYLYGDGFSCP